MAEKSVKTGSTSLDPMFYIPEGVDEFVYTEGEESTEKTVEEEEDFSALDSGGMEGESFEDDYSTVPDEDSPGTPEIIGVLTPQTIRRIPSGQQVVDVVIEVSDTAGIANYEIRVTKI